MAGYEKHLNRK